MYFLNCQAWPFSPILETVVHPPTKASKKNSFKERATTLSIPDDQNGTATLRGCLKATRPKASFRTRKQTVQISYSRISAEPLPNHFMFPVEKCN